MTTPRSKTTRLRSRRTGTRNGAEPGVARNAWHETALETPDGGRITADVRRRLLDRWDPALRARYCAVWREWDGWDILNATPIPVLEIWGDRGRARPSRAVMRIPDRPNIELAWIPNASHNLLVEAPDRLAELLNHFLGMSHEERCCPTGCHR